MEIKIKLRGVLSDLRQFLATESPLKMMKNASYFTLKALFAPKIFKFLYYLFGHVDKWLDQKGKVNFKIMTWQPEKQLQYTLSDISRSKCNHTKKFGQLIEYNTRNIFLVESCTKFGGQTSPRPFYENQNRAYLWINSLKCYNFCFSFMSKSKTTKTLKLSY